MQFTISHAKVVIALALAAGFNIATTAPTRRDGSDIVNQCTVTHGDAGNTFHLIAAVGAVSLDTICNSIEEWHHIDWSAIKKDTDVVDDPGVQCSVNATGEMDLSVTYTGGTPQTQLGALSDALRAAFETGVTFNGSLCDLSGIP